MTLLYFQFQPHAIQNIGRPGAFSTADKFAATSKQIISRRASLKPPKICAKKVRFVAPKFLATNVIYHVIRNSGVNDKVTNMSAEKVRTTLTRFHSGILPDSPPVRTEVSHHQITREMNFHWMGLEESMVPPEHGDVHMSSPDFDVQMEDRTPTRLMYALCTYAPMPKLWPNSFQSVSHRQKWPNNQQSETHPQLGPYNHQSTPPPQLWPNNQLSSMQRSCTNNHQPAPTPQIWPNNQQYPMKNSWTNHHQSAPTSQIWPNNHQSVPSCRPASMKQNPFQAHGSGPLLVF